VEFTVQAIVTTSDLEVFPAEVDFGYCTIYEAIRTEISLTNHSLLPQEFGFVGLPKVPAVVRPWRGEGGGGCRGHGGRDHSSRCSRFRPLDTSGHPALHTWLLLPPSRPSPVLAAPSLWPPIFLAFSLPLVWYTHRAPVSLPPCLPGLSLLRPSMTA
jgi:hypothetical protein